MSKGGESMVGKTVAVIVAAGSGSRMNSDKNKQFMELGGIPVLTRTLKVFDSCKRIDEIIIVMNRELIENCKNEIIEPYNIMKNVKIVPGGKERGDSVLNGLKAIDNETGIVVIHDGARPFVTEEIIVNSIEDALSFGGSCVAVKAKDTIKQSGEGGFISHTLDRSSLWMVQTPQTFKKELLEKAYEKATLDGFSGTDDCSVVERMGVEIKLTKGSYKNIKITTMEDIAIGEAFLAE